MLACHALLVEPWIASSTMHATLMGTGLTHCATRCTEMLFGAKAVTSIVERDAAKASIELACLKVFHHPTVRDVTVGGAPPTKASSD